MPKYGGYGQSIGSRGLNHGQLSFGQNHAQFVGMPIEDIKETNQLMYGRAVANRGVMNTVEQQTKQMDVNTWNEVNKAGAVDKLLNQFNEIATADSYQYADTKIYNAVRDLQNDKLLIDSMKQKAAYNQVFEDAKKNKVDNGRINRWKNHYERNGKTLTIDPDTGETQNLTGFRDIAIDPKVDEKVLKLVTAAKGNGTEQQARFNSSGQLDPNGANSLGFLGGGKWLVNGTVKVSNDAELASAIGTVLMNDPDAMAYFGELRDLDKYERQAVDPTTGKYMLDKEGNPIDGEVVTDMNGNIYVKPHNYLNKLEQLGYTKDAADKLIAKYETTGSTVNGKLKFSNNDYKKLYENNFVPSIISKYMIAGAGLNHNVEMDFHYMNNAFLLQEMQFDKDKKLAKYKHDLDNEKKQYEIDFSLIGNPNIPATIDDYSKMGTAINNSYTNVVSTLETTLRNNGKLTGNQRVKVTRKVDKDGKSIPGSVEMFVTNADGSPIYNNELIKTNPVTGKYDKNYLPAGIKLDSDGNPIGKGVTKNVIPTTGTDGKITFTTNYIIRTPKTVSGEDRVYMGGLMNNVVQANEAKIQFDELDNRLYNTLKSNTNASALYTMAKTELANSMDVGFNLSRSGRPNLNSFIEQFANSKGYTTYSDKKGYTWIENLSENKYTEYVNEFIEQAKRTIAPDIYSKMIKRDDKYKAWLGSDKTANKAIKADLENMASAFSATVPFFTIGDMKEEKALQSYLKSYVSVNGTLFDNKHQDLSSIDLPKGYNAENIEELRNNLINGIDNNTVGVSYGFDTDGTLKLLLTPYETIKEKNSNTSVTKSNSILVNAPANYMPAMTNTFEYAVVNLVQTNISKNTGGTSVINLTTNPAYAMTIKNNGTAASPAVFTVTDINGTELGSGKDVSDVSNVIIEQYRLAVERANSESK